MKRYTSFKSSIKQMHTSKTVLDDLRDEIDLLQEIDDILDEINMVKRVLREQERVMLEFLASQSPRSNNVNDTGHRATWKNDFTHPTHHFFERLEDDANRVRSSVSLPLRRGVWNKGTGERAECNPRGEKSKAGYLLANRSRLYLIYANEKPTSRKQFLQMSSRRSSSSSRGLPLFLYVYLISRSRTDISFVVGRW
jgi:hypothetical protein